MGTQCIRPNPQILAQEMSGMDCEVDQLLYCFTQSLGEGKCQSEGAATSQQMENGAKHSKEPR